MRRLLPRFSLARLLAATAVVAMFFGYANHRRERYRAEVESLWQAGVYLGRDGEFFSSIDEAAGGFWPRMPNEAIVYAGKEDSGMLHVGGVPLDLDLAQERCRELNFRVQALGVGRLEVASYGLFESGEGRRQWRRWARQFRNKSAAQRFDRVGWMGYYRGHGLLLSATRGICP